MLAQWVVCEATSPGVVGSVPHSSGLLGEALRSALKPITVTLVRIHFKLLNCTFRC